MTHITVYQTQGVEFTAFRCIGHAGYADAGEDIVCAAISVLVINTINSVERLAGDSFHLETDPESGLIDFSLKEGYSKESLLFLRSLVLGLQGIQSNYVNDYMTLEFKEV